MMGWNFSKEKQLKKYIDWYLYEKGYSKAVVFRPTLFHTYSFFKPVIIGRELLDEMNKVKENGQDFVDIHFAITSDVSETALGPRLLRHPRQAA